MTKGADLSRCWSDHEHSGLRAAEQPGILRPVSSDHPQAGRHIMARNPVVDTFPLRRNAFQGWICRVYADGMYDAYNGIAVTPSFESWGQLESWLLDNA
jgi:hypothetical protein